MAVEIVLDKIEERDVDFVVMQAFMKPWFVDFFLAYTGLCGAEVIHIEHSLTDPQFGESDITVIVEGNGTRHGLLIENKIDAKAMPEQQQRYRSRGKKGIQNESYSDFTVFLIAPQAYLDTNEEAGKYPNRISYEEMRELFYKQGDAFSVAVLERALKKQASGYVVQEVPSITKFWRELYRYSNVSGYEVEMYEGAGAKGGRSTWPQFRVPLKGTALYYKAKFGVVDLQFSGKKTEGQRLRQDLEFLRDEDMHWEDTGNSISLRIKVRDMDFTKEFSDYRDSGEVNLMLRAVERLRKLAVRLNDMGYIV